MLDMSWLTEDDVRQLEEAEAAFAEAERVVKWTRLMMESLSKYRSGDEEYMRKLDEVSRSFWE